MSCCRFQFRLSKHLASIQLSVYTFVTCKCVSSLLYSVSLTPLYILGWKAFPYPYSLQLMMTCYFAIYLYLYCHYRLTYTFLAIFCGQAFNPLLELARYSVIKKHAALPLLPIWIMASVWVIRNPYYLNVTSG